MFNLGRFNKRRYIPLNQIIKGTEYKYDIFIAYSSDKTETAKKIMEDLERKYQLRCCFADRDFVPGAEIVENISNCMGSSNKVLLLISEEFISSGWCWYEQQEAFRKYITEKRNCIIPVLFEKVQVPKLLRNVTYLDFQNGTEIVEKIYGAYRYNNESALRPEVKGNETRFEEEPRDCSSTYRDEFMNAKERIEFMEGETDSYILRNYFYKAVGNGDWDLLQCILGNNNTKLSPSDLVFVCRDFQQSKINPELVEAIFQKLKKEGISLVDYKDAYFYACARDIPWLIAKFNNIGCGCLNDISFVKRLINDRNFGYIHLPWQMSETLKSALINKEWTEEEKISLLDAAAELNRKEVVNYLMTRIPESKIPFKLVPKLIASIDDETCIRMLKSEMMEQNYLHQALRFAIGYHRIELVKEILKLGVQLNLTIFSNGHNFEILEILIQQYPWSLAELQEMDKLALMGLKGRRLVRNEIQKANEAVDNTLENIATSTVGIQKANETVDNTLENIATSTVEIQKANETVENTVENIDTGTVGIQKANETVENTVENIDTGTVGIQKANETVENSLENIASCTAEIQKANQTVENTLENIGTGTADSK